MEAPPSPPIWLHDSERFARRRTERVSFDVRPGDVARQRVRPAGLAKIGPSSSRGPDELTGTKARTRLVHSVGSSRARIPKCVATGRQSPMRTPGRTLRAF